MKKIPKLVMLIVLLALLATPGVAAPPIVSMAEVDLIPAGTVSTIHLGVDNHAYLIDESMGMLWRIDPADGSYEQFYALDFADAAPDASGKIWWTDSSYSFGYFDTAADPDALYTWQIPDLGGNLPYLGPMLVSGSQIWMATTFSELFGLFRFSPGSNQLCHFAIPGGSYTTDLVEQGGDLWWVNWWSDTLNRFSPANHQLISYPLNRDINIRAGMLVDGNTLWWVEDKLGGKVVQFNPASSEMTTFDLPAETHAVKLSALDGDIWYTDFTGTFGRLDPQTAPKTTVELTASEPQTVDPSPSPCPTLNQVTPEETFATTGTLTWSNAPIPTPQSSAGLEVYDLPQDAIPLGIAVFGRQVWMVDSHWNKLIRVEIKADKHYLYLPALRR